MIEVKEMYTPALLAKKNVVGVGLGEKNGHNGPAIVILVEKKVPSQCLDAKDVVPLFLEGVQTDVVEVGLIQAPPPVHAQAVWAHRMRPPVPGISIGHYQVTAGTYGCAVERDGQLFILSNNHVLANSNQAKKGDLIVQPGVYDGGTISNDAVATLSRFVPITFSDQSSCGVAGAIADVLNAAARLFGSTHRLTSRDTRDMRNLADAAIAFPVVEVSPEIIDGVGVPVGTAPASLHQACHKCGRTTGHTGGTVQQIEATVRVSYGAGKVAVFDHQIVLGPMSAGGDSGSAILDMDNNVVGLLFAGSEQVTIANPIDGVLGLLGVGLVT
jgi:hypothetical protein